MLLGSGVFLFFSEFYVGEIFKYEFYGEALCSGHSVRIRRITRIFCIGVRVFGLLGWFRFGRRILVILIR